MGVVYLAEDIRLHRRVALKFLPPAAAQDPHARARFQREAQAVSSLDHPNVATVYEVAQWNDEPFIAMAYYEGETLRQRIERGLIGIDEAVRVAAQVAAGLAAAHRAGVVHRDLKPANIMLVSDGQVKILDFGLAKVFSSADATATRMTGAGLAVGTVAYMAPEQSMGGDVDARADVWALGVTMFEMLTRHLPFEADTAAAMLVAAATQAVPAVRELRPEVPAALDGLVARALEKDPARRTLSAADIADELARWQSAVSATVQAASVPPSRAARRWAIAAIGIAIVTTAAGGWVLRQNQKVRWAREQAIPQIERLNEREQYVDAYLLAAKAKAILPNDPAWARLDPIFSRIVTARSTPPGADVSYRPYGDTTAPWRLVGATPLENVRVPTGGLEWRMDKEGYESAHDVTAPPLGALELTPSLHRSAETHAGMVFVPATSQYLLRIPGLDHLPAVSLADFWIDRHEVTNREFKRFVDAGGYSNPSWWRHAFIADGRTISFKEAMARFTDATGRPGPAAWELGSFPEERAEYPVTGVSWYEAAAFAEFAGKSLPTIYHWSRVAEQRLSGVIVPHANFGGSGPVRVGSKGAVHRSGAHDLAGNVKEWCWNRADAAKRYILGGAWDEPAYMFNDPDARSPFERAPNFGFRAVKYAAHESLTSAGRELVAFEARDYAAEKPASADMVKAFETLYRYDPADLGARVDAVDDSPPDWRVERVSFNAAYGDERVPALMFIPKRAAAPYQAIVFFPGASALQLRSSKQFNPRFLEWVMRSGRALIHPIYKSTYERGDDVLSDYPNRRNTWREHVIAWAKDTSRAVDYLQSRPDIDRDRIAYVGLSWGAAMGPLYVAVEPRFKLGILYVGGFYLQRSLPEVDPFNFAPRVTVPVLMLNGKFDFFFPEATSQLPMFNTLGTRPADKKYVVYDTGHNIPRPALIRESLEWLDKYLGPVR